MSGPSSLRKRLSLWIHNPRVEGVIMLMILISVVLVLWEFSMDHAHPHYKLVEWANDAFTYLFVAELGVRYYVEQRKSRFFKKYWIDILAVIPFLRSFRILRVFRLLRLFRFGILATRRLSRLRGGLNTVKTEYVFIALMIVTVVLMGAFSMRVAEGKVNKDFGSLNQTLWFAVMTVIGGEPIGGNPKTPMGRMITVLLMLGGLTVFAVLTGTISAVMVNSLKNLKLRRMELDELEHHVVLCGWNRAGRLVIEELLLDPRFEHIVVVSEDETLQENQFLLSISENVYVITGDYTRVNVLEEAGIRRADFAMLLADSSKEGRSSQDRDARTVLAAMLIEKLNRGIYTTVQLLNRDNETSLRQVGVEEIIVSDEYVGNIMATVAKNRGIVSMLDELLTSKYGQQFYKGHIPPDMIDKPVRDAIVILKDRYDATLIGVDLNEGATLIERMRVNPPGDLILRASHQIIIASSRPLPNTTPLPHNVIV